MSKFDFVKKAKGSEAEADKQDSDHQQSPPKQKETSSVQVSLPVGETTGAKRKPRQMTIHEDVYAAAAKYAKQNNMSVSRLFETVMAQALSVELD